MLAVSHVGVCGVCVREGWGQGPLGPPPPGSAPVTSHRITLHYNDIRCVPKVFYCVLIVVCRACILFHEQEAIYIMLFAQFHVI